MRDIKIVTPIVAKTNDELTENELRLVTKAREASRRAYAPYSHFHVGAAIKLDNGEIVVGNNQEMPLSRRACVPSVPPATGRTPIFPTRRLSASPSRRSTPRGWK